MVCLNFLQIWGRCVLSQINYLLFLQVVDKAAADHPIGYIGYHRDNNRWIKRHAHISWYSVCLLTATTSNHCYNTSYAVISKPC